MKNKEKRICKVQIRGTGDESRMLAGTAIVYEKESECDKEVKMILE